jgi:hypothetical protein
MRTARSKISRFQDFKISRFQDFKIACPGVAEPSQDDEIEEEARNRLRDGGGDVKMEMDHPRAGSGSALRGRVEPLQSPQGGYQLLARDVPVDGKVEPLSPFAGYPTPALYGNIW